MQPRPKREALPLYLGLDCGIDTLTAIVIEGEGPRRSPVFEHVLNFDRDLPIYGTTAGVRHGGDPADAHASAIMWADALDGMMAILAVSAEVDLHQLRGISGSARPHASVYLNRFARDTFRSFDHTLPLARQLVGAFSRHDSPVSIEASVRDQIRDFHDQQPGVYAATTRIHTVASFLASLLVGGDAPIDFSDGSGTGLMDLAAGDWSTAALEATAPGLRMRLPEVRPSSTIAGALAAYWQARYSLPAAAVVVWTADTPSTLIGAGAVTAGTVAISLGASDLVLACTREPRPGAAGVFALPTGGFASAVHFRNGSLARDFIRNSYGLDWPACSRLLEQTPAGNHGVFMLPWLEDGTTPPVRHSGIRRFGFGPGNPAMDVRAILEAQAMTMANHAAALSDVPSRRVVVMSDDPVERPVLQIIADVFDAETYQSEVANPACLGAALRAVHADRLHGDTPAEWSEVVAGFTDPRAADRVTPIAAHVAVYRELRRRYADAELLHQRRPPIS